MSEFGERLRIEREILGMSQTELGAVGGVQKNAQHNYESGKRLPDAAYLTAIAAAGADITYILTGIRIPEGVRKAASEIQKLQQAAGFDPNSEPIRTAHMLQEQFGDAFRVLKAFQEAAEQQPSETDGPRSITGEGEMFTDPAKAPAPVLDQRLMRTLARIAIKVNKELNIQDTKESAAEHAAELYNELRVMVKNMNDPEEVEAAMPLLTLTWKRKISAEFNDQNNRDERRA